MKGLASNIVTALERGAANGSVAVLGPDESWTYSDFINCVNTLSGRLQDGEIRKLAICLPQGFHVYVAEVACFLSGVEFCPIAVDNPLQRQLDLLESFGPDQVLLDAESDLAQSTPIPKIVPEDLSCRARLLRLYLSDRYDDAPAYTIFTSGTTGKPKAVTISRGALQNLIRWASPIYKVSNTDRWAQYSSIGFDLSIFDIFMSVAHEAALIPFEGVGNKLLPTTLLKKHRATIWHSVPSAVDLMDGMGKLQASEVESVRLWTFCGEQLFSSQVLKVAEATNQATIFNTYGPTEACILCSWVEVDVAKLREAEPSSIPIGDPISGFSFSFFDYGGKWEELVLESRFIAKGYNEGVAALNENFSKAECGEVRKFRTGDIVQRSAKGVHFRKRRDKQIKLSGNRIDLSEVEATIRQAGCNSARCLEIDGILAAFFVGEAFSEVEIRTYLKNRLAPYSVPKAVLRLEKMPHTVSGKIDAKALNEIYQERIENENKTV